jgi:dTDP-4-dehydrorhamnose 3,5-epimerase
MSNDLPEVYILRHQITVDERGSFQKILSESGYANSRVLKFSESAISINRVKGTIRGMHFKKYPSMEWKLVTCTNGTIFDVTIDVRKKSKNYGRGYVNKLSANSGMSLVIPPGFAHGYQTLTDDAHLYYQFTESHHFFTDSRLLWNDPFLGIDWPEPVSNISVLDKDAPSWPVEY